MPPDPTALLEAAKREAQAGCPCRMVAETGTMCGEDCRCAPHSLRVSSIMGDDPCKWAGHASINRALRIAERVGRYQQAAECYDIYNALAQVGDNPKIEPALREERDRVLADLREGEK
jgi:hypothetical protein